MNGMKLNCELGESFHASKFNKANEVVICPYLQKKKGRGG